jgi:hypothetical protein
MSSEAKKIGTFPLSEPFTFKNLRIGAEETEDTITTHDGNTVDGEGQTEKGDSRGCFQANWQINAIS